MMSSSPPIDQNRPARVMSMPTSAVVRKVTSPPSRPKPLSMYWMKAAMKRSTTFKSPMALRSDRAGRRCRGASQGGTDAPRRVRAAGAPPSPIRGSAAFGGIGALLPQEPAGGGAAVFLGLGAPRPVERGAVELGGHQALELHLLLDAEREELVRRLADLEVADGALAAGDELGERPGVLADILGDLSLHAHRLPVGRSGGVETRPRVEDPLVAAEDALRRAGKQRPHALVEAIHSKVYALRLPHQLVDPAHRRGDPLKLLEIEPLDAARHVLEHGGLVLERLHLVVDLLERARRLQQILGIVGGVEHRDRCRRRSRQHERAGDRDGSPRGIGKDGPDLPHLWSPSRLWRGGQRSSAAAAQSRPEASSQRRAKSPAPCSARIWSMRCCAAGSEAPQKASATLPRPRSNSRLPRRDCR